MEIKRYKPRMRILLNMNSHKTIKHLVLSGGGATGFAFYGALRESNKTGFWDIHNIETTHSTSVGGIFLTFVVLLKMMTWEEYDILIYKRPWDQVYNFKMENLLNFYQNCGILGRKTIVDTFYPVFTSLDISLDVTLHQFYEITGIEMHYYVTDLTEFELVDLSYKTHPDWTVVDAVHASSALPVLFQPTQVNGKLYADGAIFCNYPVKQCIEIADDPDEILGLYKSTPKKEDSPNSNRNNNMLDYLMTIMDKLLNRIAIETPNIKNNIEFIGESTNAYGVYKVMYDPVIRLALIDSGIDVWNEFYEKTYSPTITNHSTET